MENKQTNKKNIVKKIVDDMKESTHVVHEINKENFAAEKEMAKNRHIKNTTPSPEFENFKKAKGIKAKTKAICQGFKESTNTEKEKEAKRREEIKNHSQYKNILEQQRNNRKI